MTGDDAGRRLGREALRRLAATGRVVVEPGLTDAEFERIEREYGFEFADDHRGFLAAGLPVGFRSGADAASRSARGWPHWRGDEPDRIRERLERPAAGVLFDVEYNAFWAPRWGARPAALAEALQVARRRLATVPRMVPVYGHRYLPAGRGTWGHAVLSMYQTDIVEYGADLAGWVHRDLGPDPAATTDPAADLPRAAARITVPFWRDLVD